MAKKKRKKKPLIKRLEKKADKALSLLVRAVTKWAYGLCPLCGVNPVQCSFHFISRRRRSLRWEYRNVVGACNSCNWEERYVPDYSRAWYIMTHGVDAYLKLVSDARVSFEPTVEYLEGVINKCTEDLAALEGR